MEFQIESNAIRYVDQDGKVWAEVTFPAQGKNAVVIDHTWVDDSLRGQGLAGKLMEEVVKVLRKDGRKAYLTCPYAVSYFPKHPEFKDILA